MSKEGSRRSSGSTHRYWSMDERLPAPILKWAGGKSRLLGAIAEHIPRTASLLIEPFVGAANVCLGLDFPKTYINDINPDLIRMYAAILTGKEAFLAAAKELFAPENNTADAYVRLRAEFNSSPPSIRRAALFLYLNRHGFNGLCRYTKRAGRYDVPFGDVRAPAIPAEAIDRLSQKMGKIALSCVPFQEAFEYATPGSVVYCDPPYIPISKTANFVGYAGGGFSITDQRNLAECARRAAAKGAVVIVSNSDTPLTRDLYEGAAITELSVQRSISCKASERASASELIAVFSRRKR